LLAATFAMTLRDPRRRIAFVMVAHTGILLIGVGSLSAAGVAGATVYAVADGAVKAALWVGLLLVGRGRRAGAALLAAGGVAIAGLPLFATGLGKSAIEDAARAAGYGWAVPIVVVAAALTGAAVLQVAWSSSRGEVSSDAVRGWVPVAACGAGLLAISAGAATLGRWAPRAGAQFVDTGGYQQRVLDGLIAHAHPSVGLRLRAGAVALDLAGVGLAVLLGLVIRAAPIGRFRAVVGRLHDGSISDSATWVTVGTATIGLVFALTLR
jgi:multicomponent Na+:H+ antiporter subunit D